MSADVTFVPCDTCGGRTVFAAQVNPVGLEDGARIYNCPACKRLTWTKWRYQSPTDTPRQGAQQQQQPQPKKDKP